MLAEEEFLLQVLNFNRSIEGHNCYVIAEAREVLKGSVDGAFVEVRNALFTLLRRPQQLLLAPRTRFVRLELLYAQNVVECARVELFELHIEFFEGIGGGFGSGRLLSSRELSGALGLQLG